MKKLTPLTSFERVTARRLLEAILTDGAPDDQRAVLWNLEMAANAVRNQPRPALMVVGGQKKIGGVR